MSLHVLLQLAVLRVPFLALRALIGLLIRVDVAPVKVQLRLCAERLFALLFGAFEVPHSAVAYLVDLQVQFALEAGVADLALHRLILSVRQHVHLQGLGPSKGHLADRADERLLLHRVYPFAMLLHQLRIIKGSLAVGTLVFGIGVGEHVVAQSQAPVELFVAHFTDKGLKEREMSEISNDVYDMLIS